MCGWLNKQNKPLVISRPVRPISLYQNIFLWILSHRVINFTRRCSVRRIYANKQSAVFPQHTKPIRPKLQRLKWLKTQVTLFPHDKNATENGDVLIEASPCYLLVSSQLLQGLASASAVSKTSRNYRITGAHNLKSKLSQNLQFELVT